jgi:hypothetical protein
LIEITKAVFEQVAVFRAPLFLSQLQIDVKFEQLILPGDLLIFFLELLGLLLQVLILFVPVLHNFLEDGVFCPGFYKFLDLEIVDFP